MGNNINYLYTVAISNLLIGHYLLSITATLELNLEKASKVSDNKRTLSMLQAALLDLGNTVLRERSYNLRTGFDSISQHLNPSQSIDKLIESINVTQIETTEFSVLNWIKHNIKISDNDVSTEFLEVCLWNHTVTLEPIEQVKESLEFLKDNEIRIAALSNAIFSANCIRLELEKHDLDEYFEFVISSSDIGIRKPNTAIFELALERFNLSSNRVCYIGDNWNADIIGAYSANILPIHFSRDEVISDSGFNYYNFSNWQQFTGLWKNLSKLNEL